MFKPMEVHGVSLSIRTLLGYVPIDRPPTYTHVEESRQSSASVFARLITENAVLEG